jgi:hypothetical protein
MRSHLRPAAAATSFRIPGWKVQAVPRAAVCGDMPAFDAERAIRIAF